MNLKIIVLFFILSGIYFLNSQVTDVTVYQDRAMVTRSMSEKTTDGVHEMVFKNIPLKASVDSIKAKGFVNRGASLKILDIRIEKVFQQITVTDPDGLKKQIDDERSKITRLNALKKRLSEQRKNLEIFSELVKKTNDDKLKEGTFDVKQWDEALKLYSAKLEDIDNRYITAEDGIKESNEKIRILQLQINQGDNVNRTFTQDAYVTYQMKSGGDVRIQLSYTVNGAGWYPLYDCRMDMKSGHLSVEYYAGVFQSTGEDWKNVNLTFSTARPDLSGQVPAIYPWELDYTEYTVKSNNMSKSRMTESPKKDYDEGALDIKEEMISEEENIATVDSKGVSIDYTISSKTTVLSGQKERKVTISSGIDLKPEFHWAIVPRYNNSSFLNGRIVNTSAFTFLPGEMSIYIDDSFIGKSSMALINPSQEFDLSLGRDPRITSELALDNYEKSKVFSRNKEKRRYLITISNNSVEDVEISIRDIIPKSIISNKVSVRVIKIDPDTKDIESGSIYNWKLKIGKNSKIKIIEEWEVEYPENGNIIGL